MSSEATRWNDGDETVAFDGYVRPAVDLDRFLQAIFEVLNAGSTNRPPLFYMAHLPRRRTRVTRHASEEPCIESL